MPNSTILQFFAISVVISLIRVICYSDVIFKKMMYLWRTIIMLFLVIVTSVGFITAFKWFPANSIDGWLGFFISFGVCFILGTVFMIGKTKIESKKYTDSLLEYKKNHEEIEKND